MIDVHCHMVYEGIGDTDRVLNDAKKKMDAVVTCGYPKDWEKNLELAKKFHGFVFLTIGLHPIDIKEMTDRQVQDYFDVIRSHADEIVAVGEIGLEKKWFNEEKDLDRFKEVFIQGLELAKEIDKPVVLHLRKAEQEGFDTVVEQGMKDVIFHYYSGNISLAKQIVEKNYYISVPTTLDHSSNLKDIARKFPLDNLLTETDSPFSSPIPNQTNVPQNVELTIKKIAELRNTTFEEVDRITTENAKKVLRLELKS
ncbi:MAG: TatD family hydrolase [Candidatus Aenigmarchaeota archaeon]|nr:TatD family hydrolase [Candidatus Aenigmarchaeota archaeon]